MGMFDQVRCEMPLPGIVPDFVDVSHCFQTKDLPDLYMSTFLIGMDGKLSRERGDGDDVSDFTGIVDFYTSNVVGGGPGVYTLNGEDAESVEYRAVLVHGVAESLNQTSHDRHAALPISKMRAAIFVPLTEEEKRINKERHDESLLGRTMCVWHGGDCTPPYMADVVAEGPRHWCVKTEDGNLELIDRWSRDNTFFDSMEDGKAHKDERKAKWADEKDEYEKMLGQS